MTALQMDAVSINQAAATLRAVSGSHAPENENRASHAADVGVQSHCGKRPVVRPDRPASHSTQALIAVPTASSASVASAGQGYALRTVSGPQWKVDHHSGLVRRPVRPAVHARYPVQAKAVAPSMMMNAVMIIAAAFAMVALFVVGTMIATTFGIGMEASHSVFVQPGDSLWTIASNVGADIPTAQVVVDIQDLNGLSGNAVAVGQELAIPAY